jgi:hypothetical protein
MRRTHRSTGTLLGAAVAALALLGAAGCGDVEVTPKSSPTADSSADESPSASPSAKADTSLGEGRWLLGMSAAGGADGETSTMTYVSYDPSTGEATATELPGVKGASASAEQGVLLVSADRAWAVPDTSISRAEGRSGKLKVYSLANGSPKVVDIKARTGKSDVVAIGWAFDPERADTLRVVDTKNRVWSVAVPGGKARAEASLPRGPWVFTNGFNRNTGQPYVESIDSDRTKPAGNGPSDTSAITRSGGTVLPSGTPGLEKLPPSPCRQAAGFTEGSGTTWVFCADAPSVKAYYLPKDAQEWTAFGKPSSDVAPTAAGVPVVLPPAQ